MAAVAEVKPLSFAHSGKQKAYQFLMEHPELDFSAYKIMGDDPDLSEKEFEDVQRAIRVNEDSDAGDGKPAKPAAIDQETSFIKKESSKTMKTKSEEKIQTASAATAESPKKKRGRPPGSRNVASENKPAPKRRGRPPKAEGKSGKAVSVKIAAKKPAGKNEKGKRYGDQERKEIVRFIESQGRGGLTLAVKKFGISYPTLSKWVKSDGLVKKPGRPRADQSSKATPLATPKGKAGLSSKTNGSSDDVRIPKQVIRGFQQGMENLEKAFGAFAKALANLK